MLVGSVKNASLFQKFTLNLIGFGVCDLSELYHQKKKKNEIGKAHDIRLINKSHKNEKTKLSKTGKARRQKIT